jgi:hypothetical protein
MAIMRPFRHTAHGPLSKSVPVASSVPASPQPRVYAEDLERVVVDAIARLMDSRARDRSERSPR